MRSIAIVAFGALGACCCRPACPPPCAPTARATLPPAVRLDHVAPTAETQVLLESTFLRVPQGAPEAALGAGSGAGSRAISVAQADALLEQWKQSGSVRLLLNMPSIVTTDGQEATVTVAERPTDTPIDDRDPLTVPLWTGFHLWARPRVVGTSVDLDVRGGWRAERGAAAGRIATHAQVPPDHVLLVWSDTVPSNEGSSRVAVIVRPTTIPQTVARAPLPPAPRVTAVEPEPGLFLVETTVFRLAPGTSEATLGAPNSGAGSRSLTAAQADALAARWHEGPDADLVSAPMTAQIDGQDVSLFLGESPGDAPLDFSVEDPLADPRPSGLWLQTRSTDVAGAIDLDVEGAWRNPGGPLTRLAAHERMTAGRRLLLWSERITTPEGTSRIAILVHAKRIEKTS